MKQITETSYHLETIFANMCRVVGANYHKVDKSADNWYMEYEWASEVEDEFKEWMINYIWKMPKATKEMYGRTRMSKRECALAVSMFLLNYGWKTKVEK